MRTGSAGLSISPSERVKQTHPPAAGSPRLSLRTDSGPSLEEFKARLPLADIVGRYVKLTRRGREWTGLCPFHKEKSPSFSVVEDKGFFHCFGCGAHGTAIDFMMQVERLEFGAAIERLGELTGLPVPKRAASGRSEPSRRLVDANAAAATWFQGQLAGPAGAEVRAYLDKRGVGRPLAQTFGLGYAPNARTALGSALQAQGYAVAELLEVGLLTRREDGGEIVDRFRHRLMFPIADEKGRIVAFGGRAMGDAGAKYLNTAETPLFHKGSQLYNLDRAMGPARERREVILAEGYMDVIALWSAGLRHAVAPLGTAVTEEQLTRLWRLCDAPLVCLDGDKAGLAAALRLAERALPLLRDGRTLRFVILPEGEDPDSYVRRHGADAMAEVLKKTLSLSQLVWRLETQGRSFEDPEARADLMRRLRGFARLAGDGDLRATLQDSFAQLVDEAFPRRPQRGRDRSAQTRKAGWEGAGASRLAAGLPDPTFTVEMRLLVPLLSHPEWLEEVEEEVAAVELADPRTDALRQEILAWFGAAACLDAADLTNHLTRYGFAPVLDQLDSGTRASTGETRTDTTLLERWRAMLAAYRPAASRGGSPLRLDRVPVPGGGRAGR
ncbi:MAG: DNA primase [Geminicoccaceae bacterium]